MRRTSCWLPGSLVIALALLLAIGVTGIGAQVATPTGSPTPGGDLMTKYGPVQGKKPYKLAFMQVFPDNPFWQTLKQAVLDRAKADGVTVDVFALPTNGTISDQVAQMEDVVTKKYDGIILGTIDAAGIIPGVDAANKAGIPVLSVDTAPKGGQLVSLVQTDNIAASMQAGHFICQKLGSKGKVLNLQGDLANQTGQARNEGFHKAMAAECPNVKIIDQSDHWLATEALPIVENVLTSDPDLNAIFAANDPPALAALQALKSAGKSDVIVVGFDGTKDGLQAVKDGRMAADIAQFPAVMGTVGVDLLVRHLNGEEVPTHVDSGAALITKDNVDQFLK